jgi:hypothetical protein
MMMAGDVDHAKLAIRYFIHAQFTPKNKNDYVAPKLSSYRGRRQIFIYRPHQDFPKRNQKFTLSNKVGGFLGIGKSESTTEFTFEKNEFFPGE